jgi:hypothetical protein
MNWQDFEVPVLYIETDNLAFARRAFSIVNGKGKKKQTAYQKLRNEVNVVRIDGDTTDEDEVITERKVSIAEKHNCYPVESFKYKNYPGTFSNIATFKTLSDEELELACGWHDKYFHFVPLHVSCFFMFRDIHRVFKSAKRPFTDKLQHDMASMIQQLFGDLQQYQESVTEAFRKWHRTKYEYDGAWNDEGYAVALLQLYKHFGGTEYVPASLLDRFDDLISFFDPAILNIKQFDDYEEVVRRPNPMKNLNELKGGIGKTVTLLDRVEKLEDTAKWRKAVERLKNEGFEFDLNRMPSVAQVKLGDILIDEDIQRTLDELHCSNIINPKTFDPALLQILVCIKTSDGKFISIDGQHTASVIAGLIVAGIIHD